MSSFGEFNKLTTLINNAKIAMQNLSNELKGHYNKNHDNLNFGENAYYDSVVLNDHHENSENQNPNRRNVTLSFTNGTRITMPEYIYDNVYEEVQELKKCTEAVLKEEERLDSIMKQSRVDETSRMLKSSSTPAAGGRPTKRRKSKKYNCKKRHCRKSKRRHY